MVGQMYVPNLDVELYLRGADGFRQGKFQLEVMSDVGHYLHEVC